MSIGNRGIRAFHAEILSCRRCLDDGFSIEGPPLVRGVVPALFMVIGQAPSLTDRRTGRIYSGPAAQRLFGWLKDAGFREEEFDGTLYMTALTKCFPGRQSGKSTDRAPSAREVANCRPWLARELALVQPKVVILFGKMAIDVFLGAGQPLEARIGQRFEAENTIYIPLPHSSGASTWLNRATNRELLQKAIELIRNERDQVMGSQAPGGDLQHDKPESKAR
jgi:uracil-DNA glycosylase